MAAESRHEQILDVARKSGKVSVEQLARDLDVSAQTIRKDLKDLASRNLLSRVHGGAVVSSGVDNIEYEARRELARAEKEAIGLSAAALIPNNASLFINIGTTTEEVARGLLGHRGLLVITNNLNVVDILASQPDIEVIVVGGRVRRADRASVGAFAVDFIRNFKVDYAIIGASAIDEDGTLLDFDINEVQVSQTIIQGSRQVILVADQGKLGRPAPVRIGHIGDCHTFVTDRLGSERLAAVCKDREVTVVEAVAEP